MVTVQKQWTRQDALNCVNFALKDVGPLEAEGDNRGPRIREILANTDIHVPASYCAAGVFTNLEDAGWPKLRAFQRAYREALVQDWVTAAERRQFGLKIVPWYGVRRGDLICFDWDSNGWFDHIGWATSIPWKLVVVNTVEYNTTPGPGGNQSDGGGCYKRRRSLIPRSHVKIIRVY